MTISKGVLFMLLHEGSLYWPTTMQQKTYTSSSPIEAVYDVAIVGAGMSGVLAAYVLQQQGYHVAIIEQHTPASNSSAANTGLLQYSNDIMLHELAKQIGQDEAVTFYKRCVQAMDELAQIAATLPEHAHFIQRPSICYASKQGDVKKLQQEYDMLRAHDFSCDYWDADTLYDKLRIKKAAALVTYGDAEVNPFYFVRAMLDQILANGAHLFVNTRVTNVHHGPIVHIETTNETFAARHIVYTTGYTQPPTDEIAAADIRRSYAIVTNVVDYSWYEQTLIWETARPYLYMRTTVDGRLVIGGLDERHHLPTSSDAKIKKRAQQLIDEVTALFPHLSITADYMYCASFGESTDNLPVIGQHPTYSNEFYIAGYGGNGTVYSMIGAYEIAALLAGRTTDVTPIIRTKRWNGVRT